MLLKNSMLLGFVSLSITFSAYAGIFTETYKVDKGECISNDGQYKMNYKLKHVASRFGYVEHLHVRQTIEIESLKGDTRFDGIYLDDKGDENMKSFRFENGVHNNINVKVPYNGSIVTLLGTCSEESDPSKELILDRNLVISLPDITTRGYVTYVDGKEELERVATIGKDALACTISVRNSRHTIYNSNIERTMVIPAQSVTMRPVSSDSVGFLVFEGNTVNEWLHMACTGLDGRATFKYKLPTTSQSELFKLIQEAFPTGTVR